MKKILIIIFIVFGVFSLYGNIEIVKSTLTGEGVSPVWSPGGEKIAYVDPYSEESHSVCIMDWNGENKEKIATFGSQGIYYRVYWSPDGKYILGDWVIGERYGVFTYICIDIDTKTTEEYPKGTGVQMPYSDSTLFWDLSKDHELRWYSGNDREAMKLVDSIKGEREPNRPEWYKSYMEEVFKNRRLGKNPPEPEKKPGRFFIKVLDWKEISNGGVERIAELWAYPEGKEPYLLMDKETFAGAGSFSPDQRFVLFTSKDKGLYIARVDGSDLTEITKVDSWYKGIQWAPDSKKFIYSLYSGKRIEGKGIYLVRILE